MYPTRFAARLLSALLAVGTFGAGSIGCSGAAEREEQAREVSDFHYQLGVGYWRASELPMAIGELQQSLAAWPQNTQSMYMLGFIFQGRRDYAEAERYYRGALAVNPDMLEVRNNLGTVLLIQERWDEAAETFRALTRTPTYRTPGHAHNNLGLALLQMGQTREAAEQFDMAILFQPELCLAYNNRGVAMDRLGNQREAVRAFEQGIARCPEQYVEPRYRLGVILAQDPAQVARAMEMFTACVTNNPDSEFGQRCQEYLR